MRPGEKEIEWGLMEGEAFAQVLERCKLTRKLIAQEITFHTFPLRMRLLYDDSSYEKLLMEKFYLTTSPHFLADAELCFVRHEEAHDIKLPFRNYGCINEGNPRQSLVFAPSFGVFKSVISGFASFCYEAEGYYPVHGSVMSVDGKGLLFIGGSMAGKTTTLINMAHAMLIEGRNVQVLGDDWSVLKWQEGDELIAETFDPSVSLRKKNLDESPHVVFSCQEWLLRQFSSREKLSLPPSVLYGEGAAKSSTPIERIILLHPHPGPCVLRMGESDEITARQIIHDAYHYPYITDEQRDRHVAFWCGVQKRKEILHFNTRPSSGERQALAPIQEVVR